MDKDKDNLKGAADIDEILLDVDKIMLACSHTIVIDFRTNSGGDHCTSTAKETNGGP